MSATGGASVILNAISLNNEYRSLVTPASISTRPLLSPEADDLIFSHPTPTRVKGVPSLFGDNEDS